jgi:hypothetical protein
VIELRATKGRSLIALMIFPPSWRYKYRLPGKTFVIDGLGWKVDWDGFLEAPHHNTLTAETDGQYTVGNLMLRDIYGPHQRFVFGRKWLKGIAKIDESAWNDPSDYIGLIHSVFPNTSISAPHPKVL